MDQTCTAHWPATTGESSPTCWRAAKCERFGCRVGYGHPKILLHRPCKESRSISWRPARRSSCRPYIGLCQQLCRPSMTAFEGKEWGRRVEAAVAFAHQQSHGLPGRRRPRAGQWLQPVVRHHLGLITEIPMRRSARRLGHLGCHGHGAPQAIHQDIHLRLPQGHLRESTLEAGEDDVTKRRPRRRWQDQCQPWLQRPPAIRSYKS